MLVLSKPDMLEISHPTSPNSDFGWNHSYQQEFGATQLNKIKPYSAGEKKKKKVIYIYAIRSTAKAGLKNACQSTTSYSECTEFYTVSEPGRGQPWM